MEGLSTEGRFAANYSEQKHARMNIPGGALTPRNPKGNRENASPHTVKLSPPDANDGGATKPRYHRLISSQLTSAVVGI